MNVCVCARARRARERVYVGSDEKDIQLSVVMYLPA